MIELPKNLSPRAVQQFELFRRCHPMRAQLHEVRRSLDVEDGQVLLDVGAPNAMTSFYLRRLGGEWHSLTFGAAEAEIAREIVRDDVHEISGPVLPFNDKIFDVLVLLNFPASACSHESFIAECHRVLKPDGRLVICVPHTKKWTLIGPLRQLVAAGEATIRSAAGYSETELFNALKDGFDVHGVRTYSRFFVEFIDTLVRALVKRCATHHETDDAQANRIYAVAWFFYAIAFQLDMLVFFTRGHYLIAVAKRRAWRPRKTPVLSDGRSISEAVLTRPAD